ncbi:hypothetical protein PIB30_056487 [Stylosanthes scabra]|uniref:Uncharacterized protein n=1 Tax=Stylosanthes scabra TaxID=79078 RepID=A0ABU6TJZ6_9FABA|nr:hypothetical protein [Stylosanthes scabra]
MASVSERPFLSSAMHILPILSVWLASLGPCISLFGQNQVAVLPLLASSNRRLSRNSLAAVAAFLCNGGSGVFCVALLRIWVLAIHFCYWTVVCISTGTLLSLTKKNHCERMTYVENKPFPDSETTEKDEHKELVEQSNDGNIGAGKDPLLKPGDNVDLCEPRIFNHDLNN